MTNSKYKLAVLIPTYNQGLLQKAVSSVPNRDDILVVVCDDASTATIDVTTSLKFVDTLKSDNKLVVLRHKLNQGPGVAMNTMLDYIKDIDVEYVVRLDSDDYFLPAIKTIDKLLTGEDMIFYDLEINDGSFIKISEWNKRISCGAVKFWRKDFIGDTRYPALYYAEDWWFNEELMKKDHTEKYLHIPIVHYNFPRKGSLVDTGGKINGK